MSNGLTILDVGNGNCAVVHCYDHTVVIDVAKARPLLDYLRAEGADGKFKVSDLYVSHADGDHYAGAGALLTGGYVERLHVNPDQTDTKQWKHFKRAVAQAVNEYGTSWVQINTSVPNTTFCDSVELEALAPGVFDALTGSNGVAENGRRLTRNSMSAVIRVFFEGEPFAMLAGDSTRDIWNQLYSRPGGVEARILSFPHHGGRSTTGDQEAFARELTDNIAPEYVVFSNGRGGYGHPLPTTIRGVTGSATVPKIICTQLSERCASLIPDSSFDIDAIPAHGASKRKCCGGSVHFKFKNGGADWELHTKHDDFVRNLPTPLCL